MLQVVLCIKLCKCKQQRPAGKCSVESGFAVCPFRKHSRFGKFSCKKSIFCVTEIFVLEAGKLPKLFWIKSEVRICIDSIETKKQSF